MRLSELTRFYRMMNSESSPSTFKRLSEKIDAFAIRTLVKNGIELKDIGRLMQPKRMEEIDDYLRLPELKRSFWKRLVFLFTGK